MKTRNRKQREKRWMALLLIGCLILANMLYVSPVSATETKAVELKTLGTIGNIPQASWSSDEWDEYKANVVQHLQSNETAYYISVDGEPLEGYNLYYGLGGGINGDDLLSDTTKYTKIEPLDSFPGVYLFDMTRIEEGSDYYPYGNIRLYEPNEIYAINNVQNISISSSTFNVATKKCSTLELFSVSFEYGEVDCPYLPESGYVEKGEDYQLVDSDEDYVDVGGYLFKGWEDQGKVFRGERFVENVTATTVVHPIYDNENMAVGSDADMTYNHLNVRDGYATWALRAPVTVTTAEQLVAAMTDTTYSYVLVSGNITIDENTQGGSVNSYTGKKEYIMNGDCIIIPDESSLTVDGASFDMKEVYGYDAKQSRMTVQDGGKLTFKNDVQSVDQLFLSVQKGGTLNIDSTRVQFVELFNYGTIQIKNTKNLSNSGLIANSQDFSNQRGQFFNGEHGTITTAGGYFSTDSSYNLQYSQNMNRGMIKAIDQGIIEINGEWVASNTSTFGEPFSNYGTIEYKGSYDLTNGYDDSKLIIDGVELDNYGTITINPQDISAQYPDYWAMSDFEGYSYCDISRAKLNNYGTINVDTSQYCGMALVGGYSTNYKETKYYPHLYNHQQGVINISSGIKDCGLYIATECIFDNAGTLNLTNESSQRVNNTTMIVDNSTLNNTGTIVNNGCIGYRSHYSSYKDSLQFTGNPYSGTGTHAFLYWMSVQDEDWNSVSTGLVSKIDQVKVGEDDVFLPAGTTLPVTATATGYKAFSSTITTCNTVDEYKALIDTDGNRVRCNMKKNAVTKYTITFSSSGGTAVKSQSIAANGKVVIPSSPKRTGYTFAGWYIGSTKYNFNSAVTKAITLTAKWTPIKVTKITLSNTSKVLKKNQSFTLKATITPSTALNKGVTYTSSNKSIATVSSSGVVKALKYGTVTITVTAKDGSKKKAICKVSVGYGITYKLNGGTNSKSNPSIVYNKKVTLKKPTRSKYVFSGWYTDSKFKKKITSISASNKKDITLYAKWTKVSKPAKPTIKSISSKSKKMTVTLTKKISGAAGYQIVYSIKSNLSNSKTVYSTKVTKTISGLTKGKTYYVKVRAYKLDSTGKKIAGSYSKIKKIKIK